MAEHPGLPDGASIQYARPHPDLAGFLTDYHVLVAGDETVASDPEHVEWILPSWATIRISLAPRPIAITLANRVYDPIPVVSLCGTTSRAMRVVFRPGTTISIGISPLGWARLFTQRADLFRDRIVPLSELVPQPIVDDLVATILAAGPADDPARQLAPILDRVFLRLMRPANADEPAIRRLLALIVADTTLDLSSAAIDIGIAPYRLRRLSHRYFGFPPKTLLLRTRFLRSLLTMFEAGDTATYALISSTYFDASHFLRDANRFLGMTAQRFRALPTPYLDACLRARSAMLGTATAAIDDHDPPH